MEKIIQINSCAASNGHSLYALTEDGKVYERVYCQKNVLADEKCDVWEEIEEVRVLKINF